MVGDVGATNARVAWVDEDNRLRNIRQFRCRDHDGLQAIFRDYCADNDIKPDAVCFAVAGPMTGDVVSINNLGWRFSVSGLQRDLGVRTLRVVNDFAALARSLPLLPDTAFDVLMPASGGDGGVRAVIGPGTGLGTASVVPFPGGWHVAAAEGGYMTLPLRTDRDVEVWRQIRRRHPRVSAERVLSGPGLVELYRSLCQLECKSPQTTEPAAVLDLALADRDPQAVEALNLFCAFLGDVAGNFALCVGATGGVFLGGGILPRMKDFLLRSEFADRFYRARSGGRIHQPDSGLPDYGNLSGTSGLRCVSRVIVRQLAAADVPGLQALCREGWGKVPVRFREIFCFRIWLFPARRLLMVSKYSWGRNTSLMSKKSKR